MEMKDIFEEESRKERKSWNVKVIWNVQSLLIVKVESFHLVK